MNRLTQLFVNHLIARRRLHTDAVEWIEEIQSGEADEMETIRFMSKLSYELQEFVKDVDLGEAALAYQRHLRMVEV